MTIQRIHEEDLPEDVILLKRPVHIDERGYFLELLSSEMFKHLPDGLSFAQHNVSASHQNVFRGMHYQLPPMGQGKLVSCLSGCIVDFFMDLRKSSPNFGKPRACLIYPEQSLYIPPYYAHGFHVLEYNHDPSISTVVHYAVTNPYSKEHERGIRLPGTEKFQMSEKDAKAPLLEDVLPEDLYD